MNNPRLSGRYAKSLVDVAVEQNQLEAVCADIRLLKSICKSNRDFVNLLKSPVIKPSVKGKIIESITKDSVGNITSGFIRLLVTKGRETYLPEILSSFIEQYNKIREIHKVKIVTAFPLGEDMIQTILAKVGEIKNIELETVVDESLIGGFILETGDKYIDATILRELKDVRTQFLSNDYMYKIR